jgi:hypothetical protein
MPYYLVIVQDSKGKEYRGVKYDYTDDIDVMYRKTYYAAEKKVPDFKELEVFMLSHNSPLLKEHLSKHSTNWKAQQAAKIKDD